jgi:hypothetical protein
MRGCAMRYAFARFSLRIVFAGLLGLPAGSALAQGQEEIATYTNKRFGFQLSYPTARFKPHEPLSEEGRVWVSHDGNARLMAGALPNADSMSRMDYRDYVLAKSYAGAELDYSPMRDTWFVLSGTRDGAVFYERVTFTCGGRLINSWAMIYPVQEKQLYEPLVEQVARGYRAGRRNCAAVLGEARPQ